MKEGNIIRERVKAIIRSGAYADEDEVYDEAIRTLFEVKSDLKTLAAVELYKEGEVSFEKAAEIAGVNPVQFKDILSDKGIIRWIGSGEGDLKGKIEGLKKAKR